MARGETTRNRTSQEAVSWRILARERDRAGLALPAVETSAHNGRPPPTNGLEVADDAGARRGAAHGALPLLRRRTGESDAHYVLRVARMLNKAATKGATHFVIPRAQADWLGNQPHLAEYLATRHELVEASHATGITFALRAGDPVSFRAEFDGWQRERGHGLRLSAERDLVGPTLSLLPAEPARGRFRGLMSLAAEGLRGIALDFVLARPDRRRVHHRRLFLSLEHYGLLLHDLPFVEVSVEPCGLLQLDFDLRLDRGRALKRIELTPLEDDNWRLHPLYPGGTSFAIPPRAPAGASLEVQAVDLRPTRRIRSGSPHGAVLAGRKAPYRKAAGRPRDAVIFSSWVPDEGLADGEFFIDALRRWHADSKVFVGINHDSSPRWRDLLLDSGLDVTIQEASPTQSIAYDPTGFVAALDAYRWHAEPFDLVWFGHTKGLGHIGEFWYGTARWMIERMFWSRREAIEAYFANPMIGLYAPHYLMMLPEHMPQLGALQRIFQGPCAPLGAMAVSTHFVMRDESVRAFCQRADPRFFRDGPEPFGGDIFFFEMAMPNVPIMQGFEPFIEPGLGGTTGTPRNGETASVLKDWRQNNALVAQELDRWRRNPTRFRTAHARYREVR